MSAASRSACRRWRHASRFPSFFEGRGNKRIVDAELFCEKNRGRAIRWEQVDDVQQKIEYRLKE
jgi:hypothetical protein